MANQPGRQQPFFWFPYWSSQPAQRPTPRPARPQPPRPTPSRPPTQQQAQPEPLPQPQPQSPSPSTRKSPPQTPSPSPVPSPSRRSSQSPKASPVQSPLPSKRQSPTPTASRSPSPSTSLEIAKAQPVTQEVTLPPSVSQPPPKSPSPSTRRAAARTPTPSPAPSPSRRLSQPLQPSRTDSKKQSLPSAAREVTPPSTFFPPPPLQAESAPPETQPITAEPTSKPEPKGDTEPLLPRGLQPHEQLQTTTQEQAPDQRASQTTDAPSQIMPDLEPKQLPVAAPEKTTATQQPDSKIEPEEIKEEKPQISIEAKPLADPSQLPQEVKPREISEEKPKPQPEVKQAIALSMHPEPKTVIEGIKKDKPRTKPETQQAFKTSSGLSEEPKKKIKIPESSSTSSDSDTSEAATETRSPRPSALGKQPGMARNRGNAWERNIANSTVPRTTSRREEQGSQLQTELKESISKLIEKLNMGQQQPANGNASTIINLAGNNKGASMVIGYEAKEKDSAVRLRGGHKLNKEIGTNDDEKQGQTDDGNEAMNAKINSNVQSINNSLLHKSSCSERDPGVHLVLSSKPTEHVKLKEMPESHQKFETTSTTTPTQKSTYKPTISRRYLREIFSESSEDDKDSPGRSRHNVHRFSYDDKKKSKGEHDGI